jgi:hypothetical protein
MEDLIAGFDSTQHEGLGNFSPVPEGEYIAQIIDSETKDTKTGGKMTVLTFELLECVGEDHDVAGKTIRENLNLKNQNAKAVEIAQKTLKSICDAVGVIRPTSAQDLMHRPLLISVTVEPDAQKENTFWNRIKGYTAIQQQASKPAPQAPVAPANGNRPSWAKK